ncbi:isochorismate synthase [Erwinia oleae]|uniref:isochorismate synthase n=1 Tax=Erwinia oleae TaxID=796334 RepID=UPI0005515E5A|nr:isochorismate synthase [Erwinia oleae]
MTITNALKQLRQQLAEFNDQQPGFARFTVPLPAGCDGLAWLGAQAVWPQFYWQHRQNTLSITACGDILHADTPEEANRLLVTLPPDWLLVGANDFALAHSFLFVPRVLIQNDRLSVFLHDDLALHRDAQRAIAFIDGLSEARPLAPLPGGVQDIRHQPDSDGWFRQIERALDAIARGDMEKVVLARATDCAFPTAVSAASALAASRAINPRCFHYLLAFTAQRAFLGSSPERLYHRQSAALVTEALAGTCPGAENRQRAQQLASALLQDEKNRHENQLVVEDICQRLASVTACREVQSVEVVSLRNVQHLRRVITATLLTTDDSRCLERLQPTAAVAGLPREVARDFIAKNEPFSREWYAGSVGYLSVAESEFAVALRCARVEGQTVRLYAGAGIVAGSQPETEWQEINHKVAGLGALFGVILAP